MNVEPLEPLPLIDVFACAGDTSIRRKGSDPSKPWAHLYDRRWRRRRAEQLRLHPLCAYCLRSRGVVTAATVADHVVPHRGDPVLFAGPLASSCAPCHNGMKQELEKSGHLRGCDLHGMPLDPNHPWNKEPGR